MGKIECDIRILLRVAEVAPDKAFLLLACSREMYSDLENNKKPETLQTALDATTDRWVGRGFEPEMIERIRNKVSEIFNALKAEKPVSAPPTASAMPDDPAGAWPRRGSFRNRR